MSTASTTVDMATLTPVENALKESLLPSDFRDIVFYAFSRRTVSLDGTIRVDLPLPIVGIASILQGTEHFSKLLTSGFAEANVDSEHANVRQSARPNEYDYDSDSDLDEFEEPDDISSFSASSPSLSSKGKHKEEDTGSPTADQSRPKDVNISGTRHQILIPNIAYRTLRACIFYIYTGKINFLPLLSNGPAERQFAMLTRGDSAPPCSPRSIYRLAESYGMTELQELAFKEISSQLTHNNIVTEAFSSFFARYDRLREHAVSYLSQNYSNPAVQESLLVIIDRVVQGELLHTAGVLRSLLGLRVSVMSPALGDPSIPCDSLPFHSAVSEAFPQASEAHNLATDDAHNLATNDAHNLAVDDPGVSRRGKKKGERKKGK